MKAGEPIVILEAMKMEHVMTAPSDGIVAIYCTEGAPVTDGAKLAEVTLKEE